MSIASNQPVIASTVADERWNLVQAHREQLVTWLRTRCANLADAEDLAHEAMLRVAAYDHLDGARVGALLRTVGARLAIDRHRHANVEAGALGRLEPREAVSVEDVAISRLRAEAIVTRIRELSSPQQRVLSARVHGYSNAETAGLFGMRVRGVERTLGRARVALGATVGAAGLIALLRRLVRVAPSLTAAAAASAFVIGAWTGPARISSAPVHDIVTRPAVAASVTPTASSSAARPEAAPLSAAPVPPRTGSASPVQTGRPAPVVGADLSRTGVSKGVVTVTDVAPGEAPLTSVERCVTGFNTSPASLGCPR